MMIGGYQGIGDEFLERQNNTRFSTFDRDVDGSRPVNCARQARSGFWFAGNTINLCSRRINPNAQPPIVGTQVQFVEMKIRQLNCNI